MEKSLGEYFKSYVKNGGGCHEGTGYWNYGMNYAMRYLLSWEHATGRKHPALKIRQIGQSLFFPLDFTGITFGDNDGWGPSCFYFMLAKRMNQPKAALNATAYLLNPIVTKEIRHDRTATSGELLYAADCIPTESAVEKLRESHQKEREPVARIYTGMDWAAMADDEAFPGLRMAVRGGSSEIAGHGMIDLLSFRCRVNGELMVTDQQDGGYMASTFTNRGHEVYGRSAASKSTLFVDGLACEANARCDKTEIVKGDGLVGIRIDASHAFLRQWKTLFIGRLVLMVDNAYWMVIDHVRGASTVDTHWMESRFHTPAVYRARKNGVGLKNGKQSMHITFASLEAGVLQESRGMPSQPSVKQTTIFRWMSADRYHDNLQVAVLNPGSKKLGLEICQEKTNGYRVEVTGADGYRRTIGLTSALKLKR